MNVSPVNTVAAIVRANVLRLVKDRSNYFFLVALPLLILFALGVAIGGSSEYRVGVVDPAPTASSRAVVERFEAVGDFHVVRLDSAAELRNDVARRTLDAGLVVVDDGDSTTYRWYSPGAGAAMELRSVLAAAVEEASVHDRVVGVVEAGAGVDRSEAEQAVAGGAAAVTPIEVAVTETGEAGDTPASIRAVLAAGQLTLFIFLTTLTGASYLLTTRQLGITRRVRAAPAPVSAIVAGEASARFVVAMMQAGIVFFGSMILFGVDWRSPFTVGLLCVAMSLVGTGAAMLLGTLGRSPQQVGALSLLLSLVLAALGGSMQPLEFFPETLRTVAFATPHAWMNDALWQILVEGAGVAQVWPSLVVLTTAGAVLLVAASLTLARSLR
jgi:ABC-2 type transport system permease protein